MSMLPPGPTEKRVWQQPLLMALVRRWWLCLVLLPVTLGLLWGSYFADETYQTLRYAQALAAGNEFQTQVQLSALPTAPLYVVVLAAAAAVGLPLAAFTLWLSTIGWGVLALILAAIYRELQRSLAAVALPLLLLLSPWVVITLGSELPWFLAISWLALWLGLRRQWQWQAVALVALLAIHFSLQSLGLALLLLWQQTLVRRRFPWRPVLVLVLAVMAWSAMHAILLPPGTWPLPVLRVETAPWQAAGRQLIVESDLYWLGLPLVIAGLVRSKQTWIVIPWLVLVLLTGGTAGITAAAVALLFWLGLGVESVVQWLMRARSQLSPLAVQTGLVIALTLPLAMAHLSSLWVQYQQRPVSLYILEEQVGAWLQQYSAADATVLGSWRAGFLAQRPVLNWNNRTGRPVDLAHFAQILGANRPDYVVSDHSLAWQTATHLGWFQEHYQPARRYASPFEAISPLTIWTYRPAPVVYSQVHPLNVWLSNGANLVGYQYGPDRIRPGDAVQVVLHWQAPQPIPLAFNTVIWLASPVDGTGWAQQDVLTPRSVPPEWWSPEQTVSEHFVLTTTQKIPVGGYQLNVAFRPQDTFERIAIYRDNDTNPLDRVQLTYIAVPWSGAITGAVPVAAIFDGAITLHAVDAPAATSVSAGEEVIFTLYWEATGGRVPADYSVFVHLVDAAGQLVASGDGPPRNGNYPTGAWLAGDIIPDERHLLLPPELSPGEYELQVGLYRPETGERLPVRRADGFLQADGSLRLLTLTVAD